ncbi:MAG: hypothetical protein GY771_16245, partial [bacterium]|nr:hypothetical protein [bacterium]
MKKLITILALIAALSASAITFEEASDIVIYDVLGGDYEGIRVSGREVPIKAGTEIQTVYEETVAFEDTGYLFIINPRPLSIPDGDYRWVLVSLEGEITIYENMLQPLYEASVKTEVIADGIPDYEAEWAEQLERLRLKGDKNPLLRGGVLNVPDLPGEHRALLINGGYNELPLEDWPNMVNLESFWQHLAGGYRTLTQTYGWDTSELEVLSDNGDVPEGDNRWNDPGYSSPPWPAPLDLDDDGLPEYD